MIIEYYIIIKNLFILFIVDITMIMMITSIKLYKISCVFVIIMIPIKIISFKIKVVSILCVKIMNIFLKYYIL